MLLIRSLALGGAERQLALLAAGLDPETFDVHVMTFYPGGAIWDELEHVSHVRLTTLEKRGRWDNIACVKGLVRSFRKDCPAIVHSYLVEPSIIGLLAAKLAGVPRVVWGVRASNVDYRQYERINGLAFRAAGVLSRFPDLIIANSAAGERYHRQHGYASARFETIPNGVDTSRFKPSIDSRRRMRAEWGVHDDEILIGVVARLDPMKGHEVFLRAAAEAVKGANRLRFVCVGSGEGAYAEHVLATARRLGLESIVRWVAARPDTELLYPAFDFVCSPSLGEGFSNVIAEAMACGTPCIVTDVGDSARIIGDTGVLVPPNDPPALAAAMSAAATEPVASRTATRERVLRLFGVDVMVQRTSDVYRSLVAAPSR